MRKAPSEGLSGYVFVSGPLEDPMAGAEAGRVVRTVGRGSPWIVVHHDLDSVRASWPGRFWRVRIIEAATAADQASRGGDLSFRKTGKTLTEWLAGTK